jgi:hypothetical protein
VPPPSTACCSTSQIVGSQILQISLQGSLSADSALRWWILVTPLDFRSRPPRHREHRCPRRAIPRTHRAVRRDSRVLRGALRACCPRRDAKRSPREARNLLGTALKPCQNFGMYVRTAMLSHFRRGLCGSRGPLCGEVAATKEANHAPAPLPTLTRMRVRVGRGSGQKIGWREGCLLDIFRPSGCSADSGRGGESVPAGRRPPERRRTSDERDHVVSPAGLASTVEIGCFRS